MFYFLSLVIVFYNLLLYTSFRSGIYSYLRLSKMSKTNIRKNRKGVKNYWLYSSIHQQKPLGIFYSLNIVFLTLTVVFSPFTIAFGYIKILQPVVFVFSILLCVIEIPAVILASIYENRENYGRAFILLARRKDNRGFDSSLLSMSAWCITAALIGVSHMYL